MSGHSKWHNIQKTKGAADAKRSATFTKIAKEIIVAVKQGGSGDPANNSRLATVVAKAKAANMPNDNIKRTIDKALGSGNTDNYEAVTYEGYGPCGIAVIVEALTDNRQRTAPEIRHYFDKFGKGMGAQGCVSWSFDRKGVIVIDNEDGELDEENCPALKKQAGLIASTISDKLTLIAALYPQMSVRQIVGTLADQADPAAYVQSLSFPVDYVSCEYHTAFQNPELVNQLHAIGCKVAFWTVNTKNVVRSLLPLGPDCFVTDRPDSIRVWIAEARAE